MNKLRQFLNRLMYALTIAKLVYNKQGLQSILEELESDYPFCRMLRWYDEMTSTCAEMKVEMDLNPHIITVTFRMEN